MKKYLVAPVSAGIMLAVAGAAQADSKNASFTVSATVAKACTIDASDMNMGTWSGVGNLDGATTVTVKCTNGTSYNVALDNGANGTSTADRKLGMVRSVFPTTCSGFRPYPGLGQHDRDQHGTRYGQRHGHCERAQHRRLRKDRAGRPARGQARHLYRQRDRNDHLLIGGIVLPRLALGLLATAAAIGLPSSPANAGTFSISPLRVELSSGSRRARSRSATRMPRPSCAGRSRALAAE